MVTSYDVAISDWKYAGLLAPSVARLHKLATVEKRLILRSFGHLETVDHAAVSQVLKQTFSNW